MTKICVAFAPSEFEDRQQKEIPRIDSISHLDKELQHYIIEQDKKKYRVTFSMISPENIRGVTILSNPDTLFQDYFLGFCHSKVLFQR